MIKISGNVGGEDLGRVSSRVDAAIKRAGNLPRAVTVNVRGQIAPMRETLGNLAIGLALAILVIFLLLSANFQSMRLALVVLSTMPALISGVAIILLLIR